MAIENNSGNSSSDDKQKWDGESVLTPEQICLVNEERRKIKDDPGHFVDWEEARKTLNLD